ncbi:FAD-binding oxidoreductase [Oryzicola mucosus]|uniref:FAD-binding oxidoreductase n=1 Tax=Oryzicola mucosus TaxID=2767425 RepID=A0A8J6PYU0_9HYPH|nr:FAD-binding oxidoreductase [Oryzicola mucosus]MBD0413645.1 FAD-binding oxidoreductase [Oryzicola mucosus]
MTTTRRTFLMGGAAGLAAGSLGLNFARARDVAGDVQRGLESLGKGLKGRLLLPDDYAYTFAAMPNNARWSGVLPKAIARCADAQDVQACIAWARDNEQPFAIRSGGHSYAGYSTTDGLLIDLKGLKGSSIDLQNGTATLQGGVNNEGSAGALRGLPFAIPSGRCPTVGVGGLVLGGGWGFSATHAGMTCDSLLSTEVVLANGDRITASENEASDLFWAARGGGGGNFGVHTAFTFKLRPVHDLVTFNIFWPGGKGVEMMSMLQDIQLANATTISMRSKMTPATNMAFPGIETLGAQTLGIYWGKESELHEILQPAFALLKPHSSEINTMQYWSARDYLVTDDPIGFYEIRANYISDRLNEDGLETMLRWMSKWPGGSVRQVNMGVFFASGGAVKNKRPDETAYVHRDCNFLFEMETAWGPLDSPETVDRQRGWLKDYVADMQRFLLPSAYVNFPNRDQPNWQQAYYGQNFARLQKIKKRYDPDNIFRFHQSIPPAA